MTCSSTYKFQFTHPGGVRLKYVQYIVIVKEVSIHAPGRGATTGQFEDRYREQLCFNSRTREGCDSVGFSY